MNDNDNTNINVMTLSSGNPSPHYLLVHFIKLKMGVKGQLCDFPVTKITVLLPVVPISSAISESVYFLMQGTGALYRIEISSQLFNGKERTSCPLFKAMVFWTVWENTAASNLSLIFLPFQTVSWDCHKGECHCLS